MGPHVEHERIVGVQIRKLMCVFVKNPTVIEIALGESGNDLKNAFGSGGLHHETPQSGGGRHFVKNIPIGIGNNSE